MLCLLHQAGAGIGEGVGARGGMDPRSGMGMGMSGGASAINKPMHCCDVMTRWFTHLLLEGGTTVTAQGCSLVVECVALVGDSMRARDGTIRLSAPGAIHDATGDPPGPRPYIHYPPPTPTLNPPPFFVLDDRYRPPLCLNICLITY